MKLRRKITRLLKEQAIPEFYDLIACNDECLGQNLIGIPSGEPGLDQAYQEGILTTIGGISYQQVGFNGGYGCCFQVVASNATEPGSNIMWTWGPDDVFAMPQSWENIANPGPNVYLTTCCENCPTENCGDFVEPTVEPCSEPLDNFTMDNYGISEWEFCAKCESGSYTDEECECCHKWRCTAGQCDIDETNGTYYSQEQCEGQCEPEVEVDGGGIEDVEWAVPEGMPTIDTPGAPQPADYKLGGVDPKYLKDKAMFIKKFNMLKKKPIKIKESDITRLVKKLIRDGNKN